MTDSEFLHRQAQERERAQKANVKPDLNVGKVWATENAMTRMGALCFIRPPRRKDHHERAAERFKSDYEALYGSVGGAIDPSKEPVDTSIIAHDNGLAARIDRGEGLRLVLEHLGKANFDVLVDMLILCTPASAYADVMLSGQRNQRQVKLIEERRLEVLDSLSVHWGYRSR